MEDSMPPQKQHPCGVFCLVLTDLLGGIQPSVAPQLHGSLQKGPFSFPQSTAQEDMSQGTDSDGECVYLRVVPATVYLGRESGLSPGDLGGRLARKAGNGQCPIEESPASR